MPHPLRGDRWRADAQALEVQATVASPDGRSPGDQLKAIAARDPAVKIVVNARNFGVFRSTFNGLRHATGDATLVMLPVDLQDPPELLTPMYEMMVRESADVVYGRRTQRLGETAFKRGTAKLFYRVLRAATDVDIPVDTGDFRLMTRRVLDELLKLPD